MKELSLYILDIAMNSVRSKAKNITISISENFDVMKIDVVDDGCGIPQDVLSRVADPFYTTRTTRKVGLGIPLFKFAAEQTGGKLEILSSTDSPSGTTVSAVFYKKHVNCLPIGDIVSSVTTLVQGNPDIDFLFLHNSVILDTKKLKEILGDISLSSPEILLWMREYLEEQYNEK